METHATRMETRATRVETRGPRVLNYKTGVYLGVSRIPLNASTPSIQDFYQLIGSVALLRSLHMVESSGTTRKL